MMKTSLQPLAPHSLLDACGPRTKIATSLIGQLEALADGDQPHQAARGYYALVAAAIIRAITGTSSASASLFPWSAQPWPESLRKEVDRLDETIGEFNFRPLENDPLRALYHRLISREERHAGGEYYTPDWLAEHVLNMVQFPAGDHESLLDPACGSGTFLIAAIRLLRRQCSDEGLSHDATLQRVIDSVVGIDCDPLAALAAKANYLLAISDLITESHPPPGRVRCEASGEGSQDVGNHQPSLDQLSNGRRNEADDNQTDCPPRPLRVRPSPREGGNSLIRVPIYQGDSILDSFDNLGRFDCIVGNPPWVGWESLTDDYRLATRPLWERYGLFAHSGMSTILGSGKKDLSLLMSYSVTDRFLRDDGRLGFVITQSAFKTLGAGQGFRQFAWGAGDNATHVRVERVDDLTDFQPFELAGTRTACFVWTKGEPTSYPLPYHLWQKTSRGKSIPSDAKLYDAAEQTRQLEWTARPMEPSEPTSCWLTCPEELADALEFIRGASDYSAHEGANTGGANAIYWLEDRGASFQLANDQQELPSGTNAPASWKLAPRIRCRNIVAGAKKQVESTEAEIETELLYPLLRGREVRRWQAQPTAMLLMVQDPAIRRGYEETQFARDFPLAYAYLKSFEPQLRRRAAFRRYFTRKNNGSVRETGPFYSMFNIGPATFSPWKVVWHRMISPLGAAVVGSIDGKPILPQETHAFVACDSEDEAHYLAGLMNSTLFNFAAMSFSQAGGKSFGSPQLLKRLRLPKYQPELETHRRVVELSRECHRNVGQAPACRSQNALIAELDLAAADVWQVNTSVAEPIAHAYSQLTKSDSR